jgi:hypothetical protein
MSSEVRDCCRQLFWSDAVRLDRGLRRNDNAASEGLSGTQPISEQATACDALRFQYEHQSLPVFYFTPCHLDLLKSL